MLTDLILELDCFGSSFREAVEYVVAYYLWMEEAA